MLLRQMKYFVAIADCGVSLSGGEISTSTCKKWFGTVDKIFAIEYTVL